MTILTRYVYDECAFENVKYKGIKFKIVLRLEEEDVSAYEDLKNWADDEKYINETLKQINYGELTFFCAAIYCYHPDTNKDRHIGSAFLHRCYYKDIDDFINNSGYFEDLKEEALQDGYITLKAQKERFDTLTFND